MAPSPRIERFAFSLCALCAMALGLLAIDPVASAQSAEPAARLTFAMHAEPVAERSLESLKASVPPQPVRVFEPYEAREVTFEAMPLTAVLDAVYGEGWRREEELLFTCRDGYQPSVPVQRVLEHRAWIAFARPGASGFQIEKLESGDQKTIDLAPFYLVWENLDDAQIRQESDYGWPYQLVGVDLIRSADRFPGLTPPPGSPPEVQAGFRAYRVHCSKCHRLNGEGGSIGPELGAGTGLVKSHDPEWLRRWIEDPASIRPGTRMPPLNPALPDRAGVVDDLIAYLRAKADEPSAHIEQTDASTGTRPKRTSVGFFETFYDGPIQHPWLLWLAGAAGVAFALTRPGLAPELRRYVMGLGVLTLLDAWLTSNDIPGVGTLPGWASSAVPLFFVLAGDLRYLLVVQCGAPGGRLAFTANGIAGALGLMAVVPIASQILVPILAGPEATARVLFLVYELAFFALAATLMAFHPGAAGGRWPRVVSRFVLLYYGLWACADTIILLTGADLGFALRVVPNVLYYGGLIAVIGRAGASDARSNVHPSRVQP